MSVSIMSLWAPILLATLLAWIASAVIHVVIKFHNSDYRGMSNEDEVMDAIRNGNPELGMHTLPYCVDMKDMADEGMQAKFNKGPVAMVTIFPNGMPNMGKLMGQQISYFLLGSILIAYCATLAVSPLADYMSVFRVVAATGFLAYGWAVIPFSIWFGHPWSMSARYLVDALVYGLISAGVFAWLWPDLQVPGIG